MAPLLHRAAINSMKILWSALFHRATIKTWQHQQRRVVAGADWRTVVLQVKILYVRNLMLSTTEDTLERLFTDAVADRTSTDDAAAVVERVKKIRDYAFVHFRDRELALAAMNRLHGQPA